MIKKLLLSLALAFSLFIGVFNYLPENEVYADSVDLYWIPVAGSGTGNTNDTAHWATIYTTGTASFVNGDATVEFAGGADVSAYDNDIIRVASTGTWYTIDSITDADTLELTGNFAEASTGAVAYVIADGGHAVPTSTNNVYFNSGSFTGAGQTVTVNANLSVKNVDFTGALYTPTLALTTNYLRINGALTTISAMAVTVGGGGQIYYSSNPFNVTSNGLIFGCTFTNWAGTEVFTLLDDFRTSAYFTMVNGLTTNNHSFQCGAFTSSGNTARVLALGSSTVTVTSWTVSGTNYSLTGTPTINDSGNFTGGGLTTYNIVNLTGATSTVTGSNTFNTLGLTRVGVQTITFTDGTTQTVTNMTRNAGTEIKTLQGSGVAGWNITYNGITYVSLDYLSVSRSNALPATNHWYAGTHSTNGGNNTGWLFIAPDVPTVSTQNATGIGGVTATGNGTITNTGAGDSVTATGFEWDTDSGAPYANQVSDAGIYGLGAFSRVIGGLPPNTTFYIRAKATNAVGDGYGLELTFTTLPVGYPTNLAITSNGILTWVLGDYATDTIIVRGTAEYPATIADGTTIYNGDALTVTDTNPNPETTVYYYSAWGFNDVYTSYSPTYATIFNGGSMAITIMAGILVLLCLGLTIGGFALCRPSLALSAMGGWFILCVFSYMQTGQIYNALFWLSIALTITTGMEGALILRKGQEQVEEDVDYVNDMKKAVEMRDIQIEEQRKLRRNGKYRN